MSRPEFLRGVRIVDLSMGWAGPLATRHLADMGAEIIKVESCVRYDWFRGWEASQKWIDAYEHEKHPPFNSMNRNKLGITLDLTHRRGRELLLRLVAVSEAVVENFAASVLPNLQLGYSEFRQVRPDIVMVSMPGFGTTGPWRNYRAYGSTTEHGSGLPHLSGWPGSPPTMVHIALGDAVAGLNGAAALLVALRHRMRTGEGQFVDLSHSECLFPLAAHGIAQQALTGSDPPRQGNRSDRFAPHGAYLCRDGEWLVIQAQDENQWEGMRRVLGSRGETFGSLSDRVARRVELDEAVTAWCCERDADDAMSALQEVGVAAGIVRQSCDLHDEPHLEERGSWQVVSRRFVGEVPHAAAPYRTGPVPLEIGLPSPTLGQHNREVLSGILGLGDDEISDLEREGIIGSKPTLREAGRR